MDYQDVNERIKKYFGNAEFVVVERFGDGQDGTVFFTEQRAAVKVFSRKEAFDIECECYRRLLENGLRRICGFNIPELVRIDESLGIIEMTPVQPPCLFDFGKCYVDETPPFSDAEMEEWHDQQVIR
jgi:hypothetical protein